MKPITPVALVLPLLCSLSRSLGKTLSNPSQLTEVTYDFVIVGGRSSTRRYTQETYIEP